MAQAIESLVEDWTAGDLLAWFGPISLRRIRHDPWPGSATEDDVVDIHDREKRLYELVEGVLVEKTVGTFESYLAAILTRLLGNYVADNNLGIVLGADGMVRLAPGLVRIPDVSFISWQRLPGRKVPRDPIADLAPDLAIEVLSRYNTRQEMDRKLADYFAAGVRQVWYVDPAAREVRVYVAADRLTVLGESHAIDGGDVLPGFRLELGQLFAEPGEDAKP